MTPFTESLILAEQIYAVRYLESSYPCGRSCDLQGTQGGLQGASNLWFLTWELGRQLCSTL